MYTKLKRRATTDPKYYPREADVFDTMGIHMLKSYLKALRKSWINRDYSSPYGKRKLKLSILKCREVLDSKLK